MRSLRRTSLLLALAVVLGLAACGEDGADSESSADARELVTRAFNTTINSGRLDMELEVQVDGVEELDDGLKLEVSGPFSGNGGERLPSLDVDVAFSGAGQSLSGGLVVTEDNAFVSFGGETYEIGEDVIREFNRESEEASRGRTTLEDFGIEVSAWLRDPEVAGEEEVDGTETTKVSGQVDVARVLRDFTELSSEFDTERELELSDDEVDEISEAVEESRLDLYVAGDGTLRRATLDVEFMIPEADREDLDGAEGGSATLDFTLTDANEPQEIKPPADAQPLDELLQRFGLGPESFLQ